MATNGGGLSSLLRQRDESLPFDQYTGAAADPKPSLIRVSRDRIIREIVGLRPFRSEGYVVEAQRVGNKFLIHNYGHGGADITLAWGTATRDVESSPSMLRYIGKPAVWYQLDKKGIKRRFSPAIASASGSNTSTPGRFYNGGRSWPPSAANTQLAMTPITAA